jgi:hypothetical protein
MTDFANEQGRRVWEFLDSTLVELKNRDASLSSIIEDNEDCRRQRDELERLHAALKTYLDTDARFRYAAFVGSFSSGKTATINNLLRLSPEERRAEDINPVDERLTICIHEERKDSVLATLIKSTWDADKFFHLADDLADIILVDTPGGGDPKVRTDIVYNFLPICDTIVYCFNATNPLNTNDLPILRELNEVLQHTDFFYVYTRADNVFRLHEGEALTAKNLDQAKAARQRDVFTSRLTQALAGMPVRIPELLFVSNAAGQYGIEELRQRLLTPAGDVTTLGLRKVAFFRARSVDSIGRILKILRELRITVGELVQSYAGFWVTRRSGGVVCRHLDDLDAVLEFDACDDLRQVICTFESPPGL